MERKIIKTGDGSVTIHLPEWNEQYHSKHGAVQEALHVFLKTGLEFYLQQQAKEEISILEIGFGTGLNAFLTALQAEKLQLKVNYTGVEAYPIEAAELQDLNYAEVVSEEDKKEILLKMHETSWEEEHEITPFFKLIKEQRKFQDIEKTDKFDLVYFDAFGARVQPELWTEAIFEIMYKAMKPKGVLVTYAAKGSVRRAMQAVGFQVERLPGPPGKREMLRASKA